VRLGIPRGKPALLVRQSTVSLVISDHMLQGDSDLLGHYAGNLGRRRLLHGKTEPVETFLVMIRDQVNRYWG
jgi:hypothetical protein